MKNRSTVVTLLAIGLSVLLAACGANNQDENKNLGDDTASSINAIAAAIMPTVMKDATTARYCRSSRRGSPCLMSFENALQYCASVGGHVPTNREWISLSISRSDSGAFHQPDHPELSCGSPGTRYEDGRISVLGFSGYVSVKRDGLCFRDFYYRFRGYHAPEGEESALKFWAYAEGYRNILDNSSGDITDAVNSIYAVRCMPGGVAQSAE